MSEFNSKTIKIENDMIDGQKSKVTRYDFSEFSKELLAIQRRNKVAKKLENQTRVSENKMTKQQIHSTIKEIMKQNIIDKRLETLEPKPILNDLFSELDDRFFNGFLQTNNVKAVWSRRVKNEAKLTHQKVEGQKQNSLEISLSRTLFKNSSRKDITESLLFLMIQTYLMLTTKEYSINNKVHRNLLISKIKEINDLAKTDIKFNQIESDLKSKLEIIEKRIEDRLEDTEEEDSDLSF